MVLAGMVASYQEPAPKVRATKAPKAVKAIKVAKAASAETVVVIPASNGHEGEIEVKLTPALILPEVGTLNATEFQVALRNAGRRVDAQGRPFTNQEELRDDQIKAIAGYCGYDLSKDFGSQDLAARSKAVREIRGSSDTGPTRSEVRRVMASTGGYVAGLPDNHAKALANLQARERLAVAELIDNDAKAGSLSGSRYYGAEVLPRVKGEIELPAMVNAAPSEQARGTAVAMTQVERERLLSIRKDLSDFSGE